MRLLERMEEEDAISKPCRKRRFVGHQDQVRPPASYRVGFPTLASQ